MTLPIKKTHSWLVLALLLSISFSKAYPNIILALLLAVVFLDRKRQLGWSKISLVFGILLGYLFLKSAVFGSLAADFSVLSRFLIVLLVPLLIYPVGRAKIMLFTLFSVFTAIVIASVRTISYYIDMHKIPFDNGQVINSILVLERPYLGFFCLLGWVACFFLVSKYPRYKIKLVVLSFFILAFVVLIAARLALISMLLIAALYLFFFSGLSFLKKAAIILSGLVLAVILLFSYGNIRTRFLTNASREKIDRYDPRFDIWSCAYGITKSDHFNALTGCAGYGVIENDLLECYKTKSGYDLQRRAWFMETRFNTHNQFIDFFLVGGSIALFGFVLVIFLMFRQSGLDFYCLAIVIALTLFFIFENVLHRQFGCYLIAIVLAVLLDSKRNNRAELTAHPSKKPNEKSFS